MQNNSCLILYSVLLSIWGHYPTTLTFNVTQGIFHFFANSYFCPFGKLAIKCVHSLNFSSPVYLPPVDKEWKEYMTVIYQSHTITHLWCHQAKWVWTKNKNLDSNICFISALYYAVNPIKIDHTVPEIYGRLPKKWPLLVSTLYL